MGAILGVAGLIGNAVSGSQQAPPPPPSMFDTSQEEDITGFNQQQTVDEEYEDYDEDYDDGGSITGYEE